MLYNDSLLPETSVSVWQKSAAVSSPGPGPSAGGAAASVEKSSPRYVTIPIVAW